jgi:hypothetical protein
MRTDPVPDPDPQHCKTEMQKLQVGIVALDGLRLYVVIKCRLCMWRGRMFYTE